MEDHPRRRVPASRAPPRHPTPSGSPLRRNHSVPPPGTASKLRPPSRSRSPAGSPPEAAPPADERRRSISFESPGAARKELGRKPAAGPPRAVSRPRSNSPLERGDAAVAAPAAAARKGDGRGGGGFRQSSVRVAVRCRPLAESEKRAAEAPAVGVQGRTVTLQAGPRAHSYAQPGEEGDQSQVFAYDYAFGPASDQLSVFAACGAPLIKELLEGYNATIFAYGQTGSGKTHTMIGSSLEPGLIPRATWYLFERLQALGAADASLVHPDDAYTPRAADADAADDDEAGADATGGGDARAAARSGRKFKLTATYLQIYNETLIDMLADSPQELKVRTSPQLGVFVAGLTEHPVRSPEDVLALLERGNSKRTTAATRMNAASSRSHAVFTLMLEQEVPVAPDGAEAAEAGAEGNPSPCPGESGGGGWVSMEGGEAAEGEAAAAAVRTKTLRSKINLVDLAGSERAKQSGADEDAGLMKECVNINKSLSALGNVISALSEGKAIHVPYRESKLTQLLEESLGGNAQTVMINAISPLARHHAETLSTLQWAKRAQSIVNISVAGVAMDADSAMEKMATMAKLQKQAIAEAQQLARERQQELQEELDAARQEADEARGELDELRRAARKQMAQMRSEFERELAEALAACEDEVRESVGAAAQQEQVELRRQFDEAKAEQQALASSRNKERGLVAELTSAAEREMKLQRQLSEAQKRIAREAEERERLEAFAAQCKEAAQGEREAAEEGARRSREQIDEQMRAVRAEAAQRFEVAAGKMAEALRAESAHAVQAAEAAAAELGDALAAKEDELEQMRTRLSRLDGELQQAILAKEAAEEQLEEAEAGRQQAEAARDAAEAANESLAAPLRARVTRADEERAIAQASAQELATKLSQAQLQLEALQSGVSELEAVRAERDELRQLDAHARARSEEMVAALAAADARLAVQSEHREALQRELAQAKSREPEASVQAAVATEVVDALKQELAKAQAEAKESHGAAVRLEATVEKLQSDLAAAVLAREDAAAARDDATEKRIAIQSELSALKGEVTRSREAVAKAMSDVQTQVEQKRAAWAEERRSLLSQLAAAERRAGGAAASDDSAYLPVSAPPPPPPGLAHQESATSMDTATPRGSSPRAASAAASSTSGMSSASSVSSHHSRSTTADARSPRHSPREREPRRHSSAGYLPTGGGVRERGEHRGHRHGRERRDDSRERRERRERRESGERREAGERREGGERRESSSSLGGGLGLPKALLLPDFGFGANKENGPKSPPGPVEKALISFGKGLGDAARSLLPGGTPNAQRAGTSGIVGAPLPMSVTTPTKDGRLPEQSAGAHAGGFVQGAPVGGFAGGFGQHVLSSRGTPKHASGAR